MHMRTGLLHVPTLDAELSAAVRALLARAGVGIVVMLESAVGSQRNWVAETLRSWCDEEELDLLLTLGGTFPAPGPSAAECVPEATLDVLDRLMPGIAETMRAEAAVDEPLALLDRGVVGIRSRTLIVNLPEGAGALLFLAAVVDLLPSVVAHLQGDAAAPRFAAVGAASSAQTEERAGAPDAADAGTSPPAASGLDAAEFAAFLARRAGTNPQPPA